MFRLMLASIFTLALSVGQVIGIAPLPSPQLQTYLQLTDAQVAQILKFNSDYQDWAQAKYMRIAQVQAEISVETAKSPLDPMALGVRYAEIEAIRREMNDHLAQTRTQIAGVLTDPQKLLVTALDNARKLQPVIAEAECQNVLAPQATGTIVPAISYSYASLLLGTISFPSTCGVMILNPVPGVNIAPTAPALQKPAR